MTESLIRVMEQGVESRAQLLANAGRAAVITKIVTAPDDDILRQLISPKALALLEEWEASYREELKSIRDTNFIATMPDRGTLFPGFDGSHIAGANEAADHIFGELSISLANLESGE